MTEEAKKEMAIANYRVSEVRYGLGDGHRPGREKIALIEQGVRSFQGGKFGPREQKGAYNYVDAWPLRAIWEPYMSERRSA